MDTVIDVNEFVQYVGALIAVVNPIGVIPILLALTPGYSTRRRAEIALVASMTVLVTLLVASWLGREILDFFAITPQLFRVAGGLVILLVALSMVQPKAADGATATPTGSNPAIVPLGIPLLAGPGAIATAILYAGHHHDSFANHVAHTAGIATATAVTLGCLLAAAPLERLLGENGMRIATQIMGLILAAIGIEMMVGGLSSHFGLAPVAAIATS